MRGSNITVGCFKRIVCVTTWQVLIPQVCIYLCTVTITKTMLLLWSCLLGAALRWLPLIKQHHAAANPPDYPLGPLVTIRDHLRNPSICIDQDTTKEPDPRLQVNTPVSRSGLKGTVWWCSKVQ